MSYCLCSLLWIVASFIIGLIIAIRKYLHSKREEFKQSRPEFNNDRQKVIGIFHPFCNAGGGGERVLWAAIKSLNDRFPYHSYVIYSDNYECNPTQILLKAKQTFQIETNFNIHFVQLKTCRLLSPKMYPFMTILFQNIGTMLVGLEAVFRCPPDIMLDTMGCSFIFPIFKLFSSSKVCAYVHYPTISVDMLNMVASNQSNYNNRQFIAKNPFLSNLKLLYYKTFAFIYRMTGKCTDVVMVNSTWTNNHIRQVWNLDVTTVYPPCNTSHLKKLDLSKRDRNLIISMAQFRPEKNHRLQIEALAKLIKILNENGDTVTIPKLIVIGSCRNEDDSQLVEELKQLSHQLNVEKYITFKVNLPYVQMEKHLGEASIAIHTMVNEHFGISVVEFLSAGLLTLAHNSGGPKLDIIKENNTGYFASNVDEFANTLYKLIKLSESEALKIRTQARQSIEKFSEQTFERSFSDIMEHLL